eukprot:TRINITY_DN2447_c1_g1_i1.p1 TRINITY_DN2447_c1_g1~~TRINITY_DN2447_c1_g1_i1.p1  ORF type:complete len:132 (+),score=12.11 TRINITY_DN2447_c1_g1_i1:44-397(+)
MGPTYSHLSGTSGDDGALRRKLNKDCHPAGYPCAQCGKELLPGKGKFAQAHVLEYPCGCINCCIGWLGFIPTCGYCNNYKTPKHNFEPRAGSLPFVGMEGEGVYFTGGNDGAIRRLK